MKNYIKDKNGALYESYSDEEYRSCEEFVGSSTLKSIINGRSTDHLFNKVDDKIEFRLGTAFHSLVQDRFTGLSTFNEMFDKTKLKTRPSDILNILKEKNADDLISKNKDGSFKKNERNDWINETIESGYKFLLKEEEIYTLNEMLKGFLKIEFRGLKITSCLDNSIIEKPFFWEDDIGLNKKCKPDFYFFIGEEIYLFDIKTYGKDVEQFGYDFQNSGYWVQACHYKEGVNSHYPENIVKPMAFCVSSKKQPFLSQIYPMDLLSDESLKVIDDQYINLCLKYKNWLDKGRVKKGYIKEEGKLKFK